ncbi:MAG: UDP-N-acetylglucosamine 2-epimerase (non-hydrolyzing) [Ignavibacteriae bacterium]|nr:UDP-N-acetylglucosamine 2-epimerase (non-hydrolyzing) [Ignavibacteriota bacterium]
MKKIISVVGARPNFMKMAPLHKELLKHKNKVLHKIVHTGQHYDKQLSEIFFKQLGLPKPHINLGVGSGSHAEQTAEMMVKFEKVVLKEKPDLVLVYGDINSTLAASIVCAKILQNGKPVPVAHIEAGLRSFDRNMPEEINRLVTDSLADYLFVPEEDGMTNLHNSGIESSRIFFVGNIMIDSLIGYLPKARKSKILKDLCITQKNYALVTLHRPSNVDSKSNFLNILGIFKHINKLNPDFDIVFPVHPRTIKMIEKFNLYSELDKVKNLILTEPIGYIDFLSLTVNSKFVITDSGGIQEETSYLNIPCLTLRENTERPITIKHGSNILCGSNGPNIVNEIKKILNGNAKNRRKLKLYDGQTAPRIVKVIIDKILRSRA